MTCQLHAERGLKLGSEFQGFECQVSSRVEAIAVQELLGLVGLCRAFEFKKVGCRTGGRLKEGESRLSKVIFFI